MRQSSLLPGWAEVLGLGVIEVACKSGCGGGTTVAIWAAVAAVAAALGVSVALCVLLSKPGKAIVDIKPKHVAFGSVSDDKFVVGYGIDRDERHGDLSYISAVEAARELLPT